MELIRKNYSLDHQSYRKKDAKNNQYNGASANLLFFFLWGCFLLGDGFVHGQINVQRLKKLIPVGILSGNGCCAGVCTHSIQPRCEGRKRQNRLRFPGSKHCLLVHIFKSQQNTTSDTDF